MAKKNKKGECDKVITLPPKTIKGLDKLAVGQRMTTKPYMERVLIEHEKITNLKK